MDGKADQTPLAMASWPKRVALAALMFFLAINVWTGGPLGALWIGSRVQSGSGGSLTIRPLTAITVFASLAVITFVLAKLVSLVAGAYDRASGITPNGRRTRATWLGADRPAGGTTTMLERSLVAMVVLAALAFEVWFFFYSTSPIDNRSGRSQLPGLTPARVVAFDPWLSQSTSSAVTSTSTTPAATTTSLARSSPTTCGSQLSRRVSRC